MYFYICFQYFTKIGCCGLLNREAATAMVLTTDGRSGSLAGLSIAGFGMGDPPAFAAGVLPSKTGRPSVIPPLWRNVRGPIFEIGASHIEGERPRRGTVDLL